MLTPEERAQRARIAALTLHSKRNPNETTAKARQAFLARFEAEVDPEGTLPPAERARRAECARKLYYTRLAFKSAKTRRAKSARRNTRPPRGAKEEPPISGAAHTVEV